MKINLIIPCARSWLFANKNLHVWLMLKVYNFNQGQDSVTQFIWRLAAENIENKNIDDHENRYKETHVTFTTLSNSVRSVLQEKKSYFHAPYSLVLNSKSLLSLQVESVQHERQTQLHKTCADLGYGAPSREQQLKAIRTLIIYEPHKALICLMAKVLFNIGVFSKL